MWIEGSTIKYTVTGSAKAWNLEDGSSSTDAIGSGALSYGAADSALQILPTRTGGGNGQVFFHAENRGTAAAYFVSSATLDAPPAGETEPLTAIIVAVGDTIETGAYLWTGNGETVPRLRALNGADVLVTAYYRMI
jgi:hypothetical protein